MIKLLYGRMLQENLDREHGLNRAQLQKLSARFPSVQDEVRRRREAGEYGFYKLVEQGPTVRAIRPLPRGWVRRTIMCWYWALGARLLEPRLS